MGKLIVVLGGCAIKFMVHPLIGSMLGMGLSNLKESGGKHLT